MLSYFGMYNVDLFNNRTAMTAAREVLDTHFTHDLDLLSCQGHDLDLLLVNSNSCP